MFLKIKNLIFKFNYFLKKIGPKEFQTFYNCVLILIKYFYVYRVSTSDNECVYSLQQCIQKKIYKNIIRFDSLSLSLPQCPKKKKCFCARIFNSHFNCNWFLTTNRILTATLNRPIRKMICNYSWLSHV